MVYYLFFDLDGTLTNPIEGITSCIRYALEHFGVEVEDQYALKRYIGPPLNVSFSDYFEGERIAEAVAKYRERYNVLGWKENEPYPGIVDALRRLREAGFRTCMATSKPEVFARRIADLFGMTEHFDYLCGASMDGTINTKEDVIRYAMEKAGITDPEEILMIGDRFHDVEGAAVFGIPTLGVTYGFGSREELEKAGAVAVVDTVEEMERYCMDVNSRFKQMRRMTSLCLEEPAEEPCEQSCKEFSGEPCEQKGEE